MECCVLLFFKRGKPDPGVPVFVDTEHATKGALSAFFVFMSVYDNILGPHPVLPFNIRTKQVCVCSKRALKVNPEKRLFYSYFPFFLELKVGHLSDMGALNSGEYKVLGRPFFAIFEEGLASKNVSFFFFRKMADLREKCAYIKIYEII